MNMPMMYTEELQRNLIMSIKQVAHMDIQVQEMLQPKHIKEINDDGSLTNVRDIKYSYQNGEWADQLTTV